MMTKRIVVIGGGFAGVKCISTLRKKLAKNQCEIVLFANENHMVFHPLLAEVASASINPKDMAAPLRQLLKDTLIRMEEVTEINLNSNEVCYESADGGTQSMPYDQLVIACGTTSNLAVVPGMADHAFPMKTAGDALALQVHIINQMEKAETCSHQEMKSRLLTFVVVGGGFSGVEVAGEIYDFIVRSSRYYANFSESDVNVTLVHSRSQILPEVSSSLRDFAKSKMQQNGIQFILNARAAYCTSDGVGLKDGQFIQAGTVICTIGTRPASIVENLSVPKTNDRLLVNADMSIEGLSNIWAIGDCAAVPNAEDGALCPTTAQFAERQGAQLALNIVYKLDGKTTRPFSHRSLGTLCSIGGRNAVAEVLGIKLSGTLAWVAWRGTYLFKLPTLTQQIAVGLTWALGFLFPPALSCPRIDRTRMIGHAYYRAGDWIFRQGEPASDFYAIKSGEVEIIDDTNGNAGVVAVLGKDDFFGEGALINKRLRRNSCRARTDVQLLILGKATFSEVSDALAPLRKAITAAAERRKDSWEDFAEVKKVLASLPLSTLVAPIDSHILNETDSLAHACQLMNDSKTKVLYVVDEAQSLTGLVSRTDLLKALQANINLRSDELSKIATKTFMVTKPICATKTDDTLAVVATMHDHDFKYLPIVEDHSSKKLIGYITAEDILSAIFSRLSEIS